MKWFLHNFLVPVLTLGIALPAPAQMGGGMMGGGMGGMLDGGQGLGSIFDRQQTRPEWSENVRLDDVAALMRELADHAMAISTRLAGGALDASAQQAMGEQAHQLAVIADHLARVVDRGIPPDVESRAAIREMREQLAQMPMNPPRPHPQQ